MIKDISGLRFGKLTALVPTGEKKWGVSLWRCACDCGGEHVAAVNSLKQNLVRSCGCMRSESAKKRASSHGMYKTPTYTSWDGMIQRCTNHACRAYRLYGGSGITVCERWRDFKAFLTDMGVRPPKTSLDRIDPRGNYEPGNCRWASAVVQARNQRRPRLTYEQAQKIRAMRESGGNPTGIAKALGVSKNQVGSVIYLNNVNEP